MAVTQSVKAPEQFIVQMNGDYNVPFDEMTVATEQVSGDVIALAVGYGIVAQDVAAGGKARVMVRGNPSTVNKQELNYGLLVEATVDAALATQGIIVVNA